MRHFKGGRIVYRATLKQLSGLYQKKLTGACSQTHPGFPSSSVCPSPSSLLISGRVPSRPVCKSSSHTPRRPFSLGDPALLEASVTAEIDCGDVGVLPGFVTEDESESLLVEIRRTLRGKRYLYNHWDRVRPCYHKDTPTKGKILMMVFSSSTHMHA